LFMFGKTPYSKLFFNENFVIQQRKLVADVWENSEKSKRVLKTIA